MLAVSSTADGHFSGESRPISLMASGVADNHAWDADIRFSSDKEERYILILHLDCFCYLAWVPEWEVDIILSFPAGWEETLGDH